MKLSPKIFLAISLLVLFFLLLVNPQNVNAAACEGQPKASCFSLGKECFWYSGGVELQQARCVKNSGNKADGLDNKPLIHCGTDDGFCYSTQLCSKAIGTCYPKNDAPPLPLPPSTPTPTASIITCAGLATQNGIKYAEESKCADLIVPGPRWYPAASKYDCAIACWILPIAASDPTKGENCGAGIFCAENETCVQDSASSSNHVCVLKGSRGEGGYCKKSLGNPLPNSSVCSSGRICSPTSFTCVTSEATPTPTPAGVGGPGGGGGGATVAPPQKPSGGFCADSIRKNAMALETPAACDPLNIDNNTRLVAGTGPNGTNKWCNLHHQSGGYFYECLNSSSATPTPGAGGPFNPATVTNKGLSCSGTSVIIRPSYTPGNAATYIFAVWKDSPPPGPTEFTTNTEYTVASPLLDGSHTIYFDIMSCPEGTNELNPAHNPHCSYSKNGIYSIGGQELKDQATTCAAGTGGGTTPPAGATSTPAPTPSGGGAATGSVCNSNNNFACSNSSAVCSIHWDCTTTSQQSLPHGCCATGRWCPSANACVSFGTPCAACAVANTTPGATGTGCAAPNPNVANRGYDCPDVYHSGTCGGGMTCQAEVGSRTGCTCQPGRQIYPTETPRPGAATPTTASHAPSAPVCGNSSSPTQTCYNASGRVGDWRWDENNHSCEDSPPNTYHYTCI